MRYDKITGKLISGKNKYDKVKWRGIRWNTLSEFVRNRDKKCLKCGSTKKLQADHFHPQCYMWIKQFFNHNKIQTLCKICHNRLPSMKERSKNWEDYCYIGD